MAPSAVAAGHPRSATSARHTALKLLPWTVAGLLASWNYVLMAIGARVDVLGLFDDGIEYTTVTYLLHGRIPFSDFYEPYGIGLGIPGVIPHVLGFSGAFAIRLTYGLFPPLVTLFATRLVWRRCGWAAGLLVGIVCLTSQTPRYSMGFAALLCFAWLVDRAVARTPDRSLRSACVLAPRQLIAASFTCSLAGWARTEYAVFALIWACVLAFAAPAGRRRLALCSTTVLFGALPSLIVLVTGGLTRLWWFVSYTLSSSEGGFRAQRGIPIEWAALTQRLEQLVHLHLGVSRPGELVGSYGVAALVMLATLVLLATRRGRARLLREDGTYLRPYFVAVCAVVLYGQLARFSTTYGEIGNPVFWVAAALLLGRPSWIVLAVVTILFAFPFFEGLTPWHAHSVWDTRPPASDRVSVRGLGHIPVPGEAPAALAALVSQWHALGLDGRATVDVELRNDVAWGNDAIVGFVLDAPPAAWPLTYDPGLVNSATVERNTVSELCADRAPVVQNDDDYPYPEGKKPFVGSRLLDQFLAIDYRIRAIAGFYRILEPSTARCVLPGSISNAASERLGAQWFAAGQSAEAGALALLRMERAERAGGAPSVTDAALAALGGYELTQAQVPPGELGLALRGNAGTSSPAALAEAAARPWPEPIERLAAQTVWVAHHVPGEPGAPAAAAAITELATEHASWPQAIANLTSVDPPNEALFATLEAHGAKGTTGLDRWRRDYYVQTGQAEAAIVTGIALVREYLAQDDPVEAGEAEVELAGYAGLSPGCSYALRRDAGRRPGIRVELPPPQPPCERPDIRALVRAG